MGNEKVFSTNSWWGEKTQSYSHDGNQYRAITWDLTMQFIPPKPNSRFKEHSLFACDRGVCLTISYIDHGLTIAHIDHVVSCRIVFNLLYWPYNDTITSSML